MKAIALFAVILFSVGAVWTARAADASGPARPPGVHRVVFELTSNHPEAWTAVLNNVENLRRAFGPDATKVEVVAHGNGLGFLRRMNTILQGRMQKLADAGAVFAACENTMRRQHVTKADLLPFVTTVDSGVAEVVRKQEAGWAYVHVGG